LERDLLVENAVFRTCAESLCDAADCRHVGLRAGAILRFSKTPKARILEFGKNFLWIFQAAL
jgi:hypothetical protein